MDKEKLNVLWKILSSASNPRYTVDRYNKIEEWFNSFDTNKEL